MRRLGMTIPFDHAPLGEQADAFSALVDAGYTDLWSAEAMTGDGFTPLALAALQAPTARLGTAIIPAFTRGPALLAQTVASMAQLAPGRFVLGLGTSSDVIVERWNGIQFERPYQQVRDLVAFLRAALEGEKVTMSVNGHDVAGFRLGVRPPESVPIHVAALREGMLRLAGRVGDGVILNWLAAHDVERVVSIVDDAAGGAPRDVVARLFVAPTDDRDAVMTIGRHAVAAYLNVPVYRAFHDWLGRGPQLSQMWERWAAGDRTGALAAIPDEVVDDLIIWGSASDCRKRIAEYVDAGIRTPVVALLPVVTDPLDAALELVAGG